MVMTQWLLIKPVSKGRTPRTITAVLAVALSGLLILEILPDDWWWLCLILPCVGAVASIIAEALLWLYRPKTKNKSQATHEPT